MTVDTTRLVHLNLSKLMFVKFLQVLKLKLKFTGYVFFK
jgi:hypothetical protein